MNYLPYIASGLVGLVMVAGCAWAWTKERRAWNGGRCDKCGAPWVSFDTDSQGGRGYCCRNHEITHYGPWISYPGIDQ